MACACRGRSKDTYTWTSAPDENGETKSMTYTDEIQAKAAVLRKGGAYVTNSKG